ncbi:NAD(P)/FAD-dependent oxidoreductase [Rhodococcus opacus]|uniref:NAD(P)/FAD-dependent oxidoreductase n=1 Tax=Rhodococcus opacus TaxID=37919 RepID=UPI0024B9583A|nr:FAD-dependent oxidoreductase [Rhodococcus opacus]MDJ0419818.1 FAD-dependent oxidoreductase [Rhodococcus opacus]
MHKDFKPLPVVAVIGGGYAGIRAARDLDDIADVVLVEARDTFRHNIGSLRAAVQPDWLPNLYLSYDKLLTNGRVVHDRAVEVEPHRVELGSGRVLQPDFVVLATGSQYPFVGKDGEESAEKSQENYRGVSKELEQVDRILLLGAGAVGIELAGEILARWPEKKVTILDPSSDVLGGQYPERFRAALRALLATEGVELRLGQSLVEPISTQPGKAGAFTATTTGGEEIQAELWLRCFGGAVVSSYLAGSLATTRTDSGRVRVRGDMSVEGHDTVYAVGDIAELGPPTAFIGDVQADIAARNIRHRITGEGEAAEFADPFPHLVVPFGPDKGVGWVVHEEDLFDAATVRRLKGEHLLHAMYTDKLGLTEGAWAITH